MSGEQPKVVIFAVNRRSQVPTQSYIGKSRRPQDLFEVVNGDLDRIGLLDAKALRSFQKWQLVMTITVLPRRNLSTTAIVDQCSITNVTSQFDTLIRIAVQLGLPYTIYPEAVCPKLATSKAFQELTRLHVTEDTGGTTTVFRANRSNSVDLDRRRVQRTPPPTPLTSAAQYAPTSVVLRNALQS